MRAIPESDLLVAREHVALLYEDMGGRERQAKAVRVGRMDTIPEMYLALASMGVVADLEARLRVATEALRPFADCVDQIDATESDEEWAKFRLTIGDYRRARKALAALDQPSAQSPESG
jgi:hypothetical protein